MREAGPLLHPDAFQDLYLRVLSLSYFRSILEDEVGTDIKDLLQDLADPYLEEGDEEDVLEMFGHLTGLLLTEAVDYQGEQVGDLWQNHLLDRMLEDRNLFTALAERGASSTLGSAALNRVETELETLRRLHALSLDGLQQAVAALFQERNPEVVESWGPWRQEERPASGRRRTRTWETKRQLAAAPDWALLLDQLAAYYAETGTGLFNRFRAFRWVMKDGEGSLEGVTVPDPIRLDQLIGYEREQEVVLRNTRHFVAGSPANNVLLYGDPGTGKSSFIKALLNAFGDDGLRLVEVIKEHLADFPHIAQVLRNRKERFILFVDDLSFEEHETEYKGLKALLEGSIDARPENVLVYATSNRRHLVKESFGDRTPPGEEDVHPHETKQEKLSLSERFGVRVAFLAPDQERYLTIVRTLAQQEGLHLPEEALNRRAFQWAQWQNGFSGRTARQFITDLIGEVRSTGHE